MEEGRLIERKGGMDGWMDGWMETKHYSLRGREG